MSNDLQITKRRFLGLLLGGGALALGVDEAEAKRRRRRRRHHRHAPPHAVHHAEHLSKPKAEIAKQASRSVTLTPAPADAVSSENAALQYHGAGGGSGGGGGGWSDRRLKRDLAALGASPSGLPIYSFQYVWGGPRYIGVMAQDLLKLRPDAVILDESGYFKVDYSAIDVAMREEIAADVFS